MSASDALQPTTYLAPAQAMLAMLRDLSALAPFSLLADAAHVCGMLVVLKDDVQHFRAAHEAVAASKGWGAVPVLFGVIIYCYEGIGMILQIEDSMKDRTKVRSPSCGVNCSDRQRSARQRSHPRGPGGCLTRASGVSEVC